MRWYWFAVVGIALAIWLGPPTTSLVDNPIADTAHNVQSSIDDVTSAKDRAQLTLALAEFKQANDPWNGVREAFAQFFTAAGLIAAAVTGYRQLRITRSTEITDRYSRAIDQLGSNSTHQRIGGIYALERIHADSPQYLRIVREVLAAFIRETCPLESKGGQYARIQS